MPQLLAYSVICPALAHLLMVLHVEHCVRHFRFSGSVKVFKNSTLTLRCLIISAWRRLLSYVWGWILSSSLIIKPLSHGALSISLRFFTSPQSLSFPILQLAAKVSCISHLKYVQPGLPPSFLFSGICKPQQGQSESQFLQIGRRKCACKFFWVSPSLAMVFPYYLRDTPRLLSGSPLAFREFQ